MTPGRIRAARLLAVAADFVQIVAFPIFGAGGASPWNDALDFVVAAAVTALVGWHWAFLPSFFAELVPGLDLVPTWTVAVFLATRGKARASSPETAREGAIDTEIVSRGGQGSGPSGGEKPSSNRPPASLPR